jgi:outer membrane lipoprotein-sorting protein
VNSTPFSLLAFLVLAATLISACSTSRSVTDGDFSRSSVSKETVVSSIPDYSEELKTLSGKGRALVSEPGNSDRVTIDFEANRQLSLLTIQNRIGIEGGQMLVDQDSILIYNRLDKEAQKISIYDGRMTSLNELTSINILDLINFRVSEEEVNSVLESNNSYQLRLKDGSRVFVNKENGWVEQVIQNRRGSAPYSEIIYESYGELEGFKLPRKITIFSSDGNSRVVFLVRSLNVNPNNLKLTIDIPESIKIERS